MGQSLKQIGIKNKSLEKIPLNIPHIVGICVRVSMTSSALLKLSRVFCLQFIFRKKCRYLQHSFVHFLP